MLKMLIKLLICLCLCAYTGADIQDYLIEKYQNSFDRIRKLIKPSVDLKLSFFNETTSTLIGFNNSHYFHMFDESYILFGRTIYDGIPGDEKTIPKAIVELQEVKGRVLLLRTGEYKRKGFIFAYQSSGYSNVYTLDYIQMPNKVQSITHDNVGDAKFFVVNDSLYLVIIDTKSTQESIVIYNWKGDHFDKIPTAVAYLQYPHAISTHSHMQSEIISIMHNATGNTKMLTVYDFDGSKLEKIQYENVDGAYDMLTYKISNVLYAFIFAEKSHFVYRWDDTSANFVYLYSVVANERMEKKAVTSLLKNALIFSISKSRIHAYVADMNFVKYVANVRIEDYSSISEVVVKKFKGKLYIFGYKKNEFELFTAEFKLNYIEIESVYALGTVEECVKKLKKLLEDNANAFRSSAMNNYIVGGSQNQEMKSESARKAGYESVDETTEIKSKIIVTKEAINKTRELLKKGNVVNSEVTIKGNLKCNRLIANQLKLESLNDVTWVPDKWLSYKTNQTITGNIRNKITTSKLSIPEDIGIINNATIVKGKIGELITTNLNVASINGIPLQSVYLKSSPVTVKGLKEFSKVIATNVEANITNLNKTFEFIGSPNIENVFVENLNDIDWKKLKNATLRLRTITNLTIPKVTIDRLTTKSINNINFDDVLTRRSNQTIKSIQAENITIEKINNANFEDYVKIGDDAEIISPVSIQSVNVLNVTYVNSNDSNWKLINGRKLGTDQEDLLQIYNGKVKIVGNLLLNDLNLINNLTLNGTRIDLNLIKDLNNTRWLKDTEQSIPVDVEIKKVKVRDLNLKRFNSIDIKNYVINGDKTEMPFANYSFSHLTIEGNVLFEKNKTHSPDWLSLGKEIANKNNKIRGNKKFNILHVQDGNIEKINGVKISHIFKNYDINDQRQFKTVVIRGNVQTRNVTIKKLNGFKAEDVLNGTVSIGDEIKFDKLKMDEISTENIVVANINGQPINDYIQKVLEYEKIDELANLTAIGNVWIINPINVKSLAGVEFQLLRQAVANGAIFAGNTTFCNNVHVKYLHVKYVNDINFQELLKLLLTKNHKQVIKGKYEFDTILTKQLIAKQINEYNIQNLIDVTERRERMLKGNFVFNSVKFEKSLDGELPCDFGFVVKSFESPSTRIWPSVTISKNVTLLDDEHILNRIIRNGVRTDRDNVINFGVVFNTNVAATNVESLKNINSVNISEIFEDALINHKGDQIVTGNKTFFNVTAYRAYNKGDADIPIVNTLNVKKLNESLLFRDRISKSAIGGNKVFNNGLITKYLKVKTLSGLFPEDLVELNNLKEIRSASFDKLHVKSIEIKKIKSTNFNYFLKHRLLKSANFTQIVNGIVYIDNLHLLSNSTILTINGINLKSDVVTKGHHNKIRIGKKFNNLVIKGDLETTQLNNYNLKNRYSNTLHLDKPLNISGSLVIDGETLIENKISTKRINGRPIDRIKEALITKEPEEVAHTIDNILKKIAAVSDRNNITLENVPDEFLYLERSQDIQIELPHVTNADIYEATGRVVVMALGEESCGANEFNCNCRFQYRLDINKNSIQMFPKADEVLYAYESPDIIVSIITTSNVYNSECLLHNNDTLELTNLIWFAGIPDKFVMHERKNLTNGYITGVKYFTVDKALYMVITKFYDADLRSNNLECLVYKFVKDDSEIELIQTIPTRGAYAVHVFNSLYGWFLVIGNIYDSDQIITGTNTKIYLFDESNSKFKFIRTVDGFGAISISDVILGESIMLVLVQNNSPVLILTYNPDYKNFYHSQSLLSHTSAIHVSTFYLGQTNRDAYINIVTENGEFYIYSYKNIEGWRFEYKGEIERLKALVPFNARGKNYLFAASTKRSVVLVIKKHSD